MIAFFNDVLPVLQFILMLAALAGGVLVFKSTKRATIVQVQSDTITALQQQIDALKARQESLEKENEHLKYLSETTVAALKQKGIVITVEGEMVTIEDALGGRSSIRRATRQTPIVKKTETQ